MLHLVAFLCTVVCNPPCENGACVANDTCSCSAGYEGVRCNETGKYFLLYYDLCAATRSTATIIF